MAVLNPPLPMQMTTAKRSAIANILALLAALWLPVSFFINPGWLTLIVFSPMALLLFAPLIIPIVNTRRVKVSMLPQLVFVAEVVWCVCWFLAGLFFVNGGDTTESVGSIVSHALEGVMDRQLLAEMSSRVAWLAFWVGLAQLSIILFYRTDRGQNRRVVPVAVSAILGVCALLLAMIG